MAKKKILIATTAALAASLCSCSAAIPGTQTPARIRTTGDVIFRSASAGATKSATASVTASGATSKTLSWSVDSADVTLASPTTESGQPNTLTLASVYMGWHTVTVRSLVEPSVYSTFKIYVNSPVTATNLDTDGNFASASQHTVYHGTIAVASNAGTITGDGTTTTYSLLSSSITPSAINHKFYFALGLKPSSLTGFTNYSLYLEIRNSSDATLGNSSIYSVSSGLSASSFTRLSYVVDLTSILSTYPTASRIAAKMTATMSSSAYQASVTTSANWADLIDLTSAFGSGNEPTASHMDAIMAYNTGFSWFPGTSTLQW